MLACNCISCANEIEIEIERRGAVKIEKLINMRVLNLYRYYSQTVEQKEKKREKVQLNATQERDKK